MIRVALDPPCDEDCSACSGEYCRTHFTEPCDCDGAERHAAPTAPAEPPTDVKPWYRMTHAERLAAARRDPRQTSFFGEGHERELLERYCQHGSDPSTI